MSVFLRDASLERIAPLVKFSKIETKESLLSPGRVTVYAPAAALAKWVGTPGLGIEITSDVDHSVTEFGGLFDIDDEQKNSKGETTTLRGKDDHARLNHRIAYPDPTDATASAAVVRSGQASTILLDLVDQNAGPAALQARRISGLITDPDPTHGGNVEVSVTGGQGLLSLINEHAPGANLVVRARQSGEHTIRVAAREPRDRTNIVFSTSSRTLEGWHVRNAGPKANVIISAGTGSGGNRQVVEVAGAINADWPERIERWIDSRNSVDPTDSANNALAKTEGGISLKLKVSDKHSDKIWVADYDLGDIVTVEVSGVRVPLQITASQTTYTSTGKSRSLTMGPPIEDYEDAYVSQLTALAASLRSIERA